MERLTDLDVFVAVVENASFSAAADALGISRSYASRCVADLEGRLGARLLQRTTRRVATTAVGQRFYDQTAPLIAGVAAAEAAVRDEAGAARGTVRISVPAAFGTRYLMGPLLAFGARFHNLKLVVDYGDRKVDVIDEGYDLAIRGGSVLDDALIAQRLWPFTVVVVATPRFLAAHPIRSPSDLANVACVTHGVTPAAHRWPFTLGERREIVTVRSVAVSNHAAHMAQAALAGVGCVSIPEWAIVDELRSGALVPVLPGWSTPTLAWWAVRPAKPGAGARVRGVIQHLLDAIPEPPWLTPARVASGPPREAPRP